MTASDLFDIFSVTRVNAIRNESTIHLVGAVPFTKPGNRFLGPSEVVIRDNHEFKERATGGDFGNRVTHSTGTNEKNAHDVTLPL